MTHTSQMTIAGIIIAKLKLPTGVALAIWVRIPQSAKNNWVRQDALSWVRHYRDINPHVDIGCNITQDTWIELNLISFYIPTLYWSCYIEFKQHSRPKYGSKWHGFPGTSPVEIHINFSEWAETFRANMMFVKWIYLMEQQVRPWMCDIQHNLYRCDKPIQHLLSFNLTLLRSVPSCRLRFVLGWIGTASTLRFQRIIEPTTTSKMNFATGPEALITEYTSDDEMMSALYYDAVQYGSGGQFPDGQNCRFYPGEGLIPMPSQDQLQVLP